MSKHDSVSGGKTSKATAVNDRANEMLLGFVRHVRDEKDEGAFEMLRLWTESFVVERIRRRQYVGPGDLPVIVDDIYRRARSGLERFDERKGTVFAWLMGIVNRGLPDYFRTHAQTESLLPSFDAPDDRPFFDREQSERLSADRIREKVLSGLAPLRRAAFWRKVFKGQSTGTIRQEMGLPNDQAVRQLIYYARKDLRELLGSDPKAANEILRRLL